MNMELQPSGQISQNSEGPWNRSCVRAVVPPKVKILSKKLWEGAYSLAPPRLLESRLISLFKWRKI